MSCLMPDSGPQEVTFRTKDLNFSEYSASLSFTRFGREATCSSVRYDRDARSPVWLT